MYTCPSCHSDSFSTRAKLKLGPQRSVPCPTCGAQVSVSATAYRSLYLAAVALTAIVVWGVMEISTSSSLVWFTVEFIAGLTLGITIYILAYLRFVPLVRSGA